MTVRKRSGKVTTTDGPFAETKEQLAGFYVLDCNDLDEALKVANQAVQLSKEGTPVGKAARQERDRIIARKGGSAAVAPKPANDPNAAPPKQ